MPVVAVAKGSKKPAPAGSIADPPRPDAPAAAAAGSIAAPVAAPMSPEEKSAKQHFEQGVKLFNDHSFEAALGEFQASFHDRAVPAVLYNVALSQKAIFHYADAAETMEFYLSQVGRTLDDKQRKDAEQLLAEWKSLLAVITVAPEPKEAKVTVDDKPAAVGAEVKVPPGPHKVVAMLEGYDSESRTIDTPAGLITRVDVRLKKTPTLGHLRIEAEPADAILVVDGTEKGKAPYDADLTAGPHKVEIRAEGYLPHRDAIAMAVGDQRALQVSLEKEPAATGKWYKQWWFWTAAVVIVGAGVGGAVYATQATPAPYMGTLGPGYFEIGKQ